MHVCMYVCMYAYVYAYVGILYVLYVIRNHVQQCSEFIAYSVILECL